MAFGIDSFLADLFGPTSGTTDAAAALGGGGPTPQPAPQPQAGPSIQDTLSGRFQPAVNQPFGTMPMPQNPPSPPAYAGPQSPPPPQQPPVDPAALPPTSMVNAGGAPPQLPMVNPPMPTPRPPGAPTGDTGAPTSLAPPSPGGGGIFDRLRGAFATPSPAPGTPPGYTAPTLASGPATNPLSRLMGMDASGEKRFRSSLAGGLAGGNPDFRGGAFMKGVGGSLQGGLSSDKEDLATATGQQAKDIQQQQFNRTATEKELTGEAQRKLYGQRGGLLEAQTAAGGYRPPGSFAADNPAVRFNRANAAVDRVQKMLRAEADKAGFGSPAEKKAAEEQYQKKLAAEKERIYKGNGVTSTGAPLPGYAAGHAAGRGAAAQSGASADYDDPNVAAARTAVAQGGNRAGILKKLQDAGYDVTDADLD